MVRGVEDLPIRINSFELPVDARLVASVKNSSALAPLGFQELIELPAGTNGLMLGTMIDIHMYGPGASSLNTLEGCWHAYSPPTVPFPGSFLLGTGAEDYPESAYYFNAGARHAHPIHTSRRLLQSVCLTVLSGPYRGPTSGLTVMEKPSSNQSLVSFYKLHHRDPFL